jgi:hypothetical protein
MGFLVGFLVGPGYLGQCTALMGRLVDTRHGSR